MVAIGLWIRFGIFETPVFQRVLEEQRIERVPVLEVLKRQPKQVLLTALLRMPEQAPGYIVGAWIFSYGTAVLGMSRNFLLIAVITANNPWFPLGRCGRASVGPRRPQEHVHARLPVHGRLRVRLYRVAQHRDTGGHIHRSRAVVVAGDDTVRT